MQANGNDGEAGDFCEHFQILRHQLADQGRGRAERDKHGRKSQHKCKSGEHHAQIDPLRHVPLAAELLECGAAEKAQIGRHQRQHARRKEADQPGQHCADISDVHVR